jgi:hypothetical protein
MTDPDLVPQAESTCSTLSVFALSALHTSASVQGGHYLGVGPMLMMVQDYKTELNRAGEKKKEAYIELQNAKNTCRTLEEFFKSRMSAELHWLDKEEFFLIVTKINLELPFSATLTDRLKAFEVLRKAFELKLCKRDTESLEVDFSRVLHNIEFDVLLQRAQLQLTAELCKQAFQLVGAHNKPNKPNEPNEHGHVEPAGSRVNTLGRLEPFDPRNVFISLYLAPMGSPL